MMAVVVAAARALSRVAALFLIAMMLINVLDVGLRAAFNQPIYGSYELVELCLAAVAFLAIPETFLRGGHITIEIVDQVAPIPVVRFFHWFGMLATLLFLGLLGWHMIAPAIDMVRFHDVTFELHIPRIWNAALILTGIGFALLAVIALFVRDLRASLAGRAG